MNDLYIDGPDCEGGYEIRIAGTGKLVTFGFETEEAAQAWIDSRQPRNTRDCPHFDMGR